MKNLLEKIKENKLRSILVGLSAFLFGFISVSIFNNVGDTYAVETNGCPSGYAPVNSDYCCPTEGGWKFDSIFDDCQSVRYDKKECNELGGNYDGIKCHIDAFEILEKTVTATFNGNGGTVTNVNSSGNSNIGTLSCTLKKGDKSCTLPQTASATRVGYEFLGWSVTKLCIIKGNLTKISNDSTFYACWKEVPSACYACGGSQSGKYVWGNFANNPGCSKQSAYTDQGACEANNKKTLSAKFNANGGSLTGDLNVDCTTTQDNPHACKVTSPSGSKSGYYLAGWSITQTACENGVYMPASSSNEFWLSNNYSGNLYACWVKNTPKPDGYSSVTTPPSDGNSSGDGNTGATIIVTPREFYTITYNTNGGAFVDGTTDRTTIVPSNVVIGEFESNPIKSGFKFKEWQLNGIKFNFDQKPTANITLKAVYEELTEEDKKYYCKDGKQLEPTSKLCYDVLKTDNSSTYNYTLYSYDERAAFCWVPTAGQNGIVSFRIDDNDFKMDEHLKITGKAAQDQTIYEKYYKEAWATEDTCKIGISCPESEKGNDYYANGCKVKWNALMYTTTLAEIKQEEFKEDEIKDPVLPELEPEIPDDKEEPTPEQPDDGDETPDDGKDEDTGKQPSNDKTDQEITENEKTGTAMIIIAWLVGLSALGYSTYYFIRKNRENY